METENAALGVSSRKSEISRLITYLDHIEIGLFDTGIYRRMAAVANDGRPLHGSVRHAARYDYMSFYPLFFDAANISGCSLSDAGAYLEGCIEAGTEIPKEPHIKRFFKTLRDVASITLRYIDETEKNIEQYGYDPELVGASHSSLYRILSC